MFGRLECEVFYGEGEEGSAVSDPLAIRVSLFTMLKGYLFWAVLLPLMLLKENRKAQAWLAFAPYACWVGLALAIEDATGFPSEIMVPAPMIWCGLLLAGGRIARWNGWATLAGTGLFAAGLHGIWIAAGKAEYLPHSAVVSGMFVLAGVVAMGLARLGCRGRYAPRRLMFYLAPATLLATFAATCGLALFYGLQSGEGVQEVLTTLMEEMLVPMLAVSAAQYVLLASFLAIAFLSAFHRERLCWLLKLERKIPPVPEPPPMPFVQP